MPFPGACKPHAWKPRSACLWATGATRTEPLSADNERPLAQVVISSGMLRIRLGQRKKAHVSHGKVVLNRFHCVATHQKEKEVSVRAALFCVVEFLTSYAHVQNIASAHERPKCLPSNIFKWKTAQKTWREKKSTVRLIMLHFAFPHSRQVEVFPAMHSRDVSRARLASACAPASRPRKQGWLATRASLRASRWRSVRGSAATASTKLKPDVGHRPLPVPWLTSCSFPVTFYWRKKHATCKGSHGSRPKKRLCCAIVVEKSNARSHA